MFPRLSDRLATAVVTGLDVAVEFATLGEYRLAAPSAPEPGPTAPRARREPRISAAGQGPSISGATAALPGPGTAAVRPRPEPQPAASPAGAGAHASAPATCRAGRAYAKTQHAPGPSRRRPGAVKVAEQLCLWS